MILCSLVCLAIVVCPIALGAVLWWAAERTALVVDEWLEGRHELD